MGNGKVRQSSKAQLLIAFSLLKLFAATAVTACKNYLNMKNFLTLKKILFLFFAVLLLNSCKKETPVSIAKKTEGPNVLLQTARLNASAQKFANVILAKYGFIPYAKAPDISNIASCAVVTYDTLAYPHKITIDFTGGCVDNDGLYQEGKVILTYNMDFDFLDEAGLSIQLEYQNFTADDSTKIDGTLQFDNLGNNSNGNLHGTMQTNFSVRNILSNSTVTGTYTQNFEVFPGYVEVTGGLTATDNFGNTLQHTPITPLRQGNSSGCNEVYIAGKVEVYENSTLQYTVDFGNGNCDTDALKILPDNTVIRISAGNEVQ